MFGKVFAGLATTGVIAGALAMGSMGVLAAPAATTAASPAAAKPQTAKNVFGGTVTAINETQLTVKNAKAGSKTFLRNGSTQVSKAGTEAAGWSAIEVNSHVTIRYSDQNGKLYATRIRLGRAHLAGKVQGMSGNVITIKTRDGKDVRITLNSSTRLIDITGKKQRQAGKISDIHAGMRIASAGSYDASNNFDAATVAYRNK
jgi:hypothetical protein